MTGDRSKEPSALDTIRRDVRIVRRALSAGRDPLPFHREVAVFTVEYLRDRRVPLRGRRWLDAGTGSGAMPEALEAAGARVTALDLEDGREPETAGPRFVLARAERLPFGDSAFDGVVSSNVLEHTPEPWPMMAELERALRPGGFLYLSWTNWLSPWGGHEMSPFHYLGPKAGLRASRLVRGRPPRRNVPGLTLFVRHVGPTLRGLRRSQMHVVDVAPRYWPGLRFLGRVPGLREVAMWNCVVLLRKPQLGS